MAKNVENIENYREVEANVTEETQQEDTIKVEVVKEEKKGFVKWYKGLPLWKQIGYPVLGGVLIFAGYKAGVSLFSKDTTKVVAETVETVADTVADEVTTVEF